MTITANQVKELRERTGAGMMECKKALQEANGDVEAAIEAMRKAGVAKAAKKAGRVTAEGIIEIKLSTDGLSAAMVEINCETDFVGRDTSFKEFAVAVAHSVLANKITDINTLANTPLSSGNSQTVEQARQELISKLGENIQIRRVALINATGRMGGYTHGGRIGVIVALDAGQVELAKDVAMHIAAANPSTIDPKDVSAELIAKEKEIFIAQTAESGKPPEIVEKMVAGRISKFLNEVSLLGQPFVKEPSKTVGTLLKEHKANVTAFARFEVGEGIEKPVEDFAEAVKAQIGGGT
ncbi:MAG TPA: translation elongation factor Ts [Gammaproteobacteria bacterium]|nr:translation elongation factor Ts [Gammaproteobacteria bacterium]